MDFGWHPGLALTPFRNRPPTARPVTGLFSGARSFPIRDSTISIVSSLEDSSEDRIIVWRSHLGVGVVPIRRALRNHPQAFPRL
jgi:hypothetical protein